MVVRSHGFANVEDSYGRWWRNWRAHRWVSFGGKDEDHSRLTVHVGVELVHGSGFGQRWSIGGKLSTSGEETLDVHYNLGRWVRHYWSLDVDWKGRHLRLWPRFRVECEIGLAEVSWCFGRNDHSWHRDASVWERFRRNDLQFWRVHTYRRHCETLNVLQTAVPMPEGVEYPAMLTLQREIWAKRVGPYFLRGRRHRTPKVDFYLPVWRRIEHSVKIDLPEGIPVPEKDNDYWTGDGDAIYGTGCSVSRGQAHRGWVEAAVQSAITTALKSRIRDGNGVLDTGRRSS